MNSAFKLLKIQKKHCCMIGNKTRKQLYFNNLYNNFNIINKVSAEVQFLNNDNGYM